MVKNCLRLLNAARPWLLAALLLSPLAGNASVVPPGGGTGSPSALIYDLDFSCIVYDDMRDACTDGSNFGNGTITFSGLTGSPEAPFPGVSLDLTFLLGQSTLSFTEADITAISWQISPDLQTLSYLSLNLDSNPSYTSGEIGERRLANVYFSMDSGGTWDASVEGCETLSRCYFAPSPSVSRVATATLVGVTVPQVPVPAAVWLFGSALAGLGWMRRKKTD